MISIAMFNNKGGVGKTTVLCNMASYLSQKRGKKVLVVDADPQCNTTTYVLDEEHFISIYFDNNNFTINDIIMPLKQRGAYIDAENIKWINSQGFGFDLIPGSPKLATSEDFLSGDWKDIKASEIRGIRSNMVFFDLLNKCAEYDYVFFDMGPSLGAINRAILLACDFFITPMASDIFSILALENIGASLIEWKSLFNRTIENLSSDEKVGLDGIDAQCKIKFLGYVFQQYITKTSNGDRRIVNAYERILSELPTKIQEHLVNRINGTESGELNYKLGSIPNFYSLVPMSQSSHRPVFSLNNADGVVGAHYQKVREYETIMSEISTNMSINMEAII